MTELSRSRQGSTVGQQASDRRNNQVFACSQRLNFIRNSPKLSSLGETMSYKKFCSFQFYVFDSLYNLTPHYKPDLKAFL